MTLYAVQKLVYEVNRRPQAMDAFKNDPDSFMQAYELSEEERGALRKPDVGLLYVLGVNGQLLMHFAAACGYEWNDYLDAMREGIACYGEVREGIYAIKKERS